MSARFRQVPATATLRAFEAAARLRSFTRAADELGLTQGAVSHQIRALERLVGHALFDRERRQSTLSPRADGLASAIREALARIADAIEALQRVRAGPAIMVHVLPGFAVKWLFPRLIRFDQQHPDVQVDIVAAVQQAESWADADIAIRYGRGVHAGLAVDRLLRERMFPVCSPALLAGRRPLHAPADLAHHTLLHDQVDAMGGTPPSWQAWLDAAGVAGIDATRGRRYGQANMVIQAAIDGLGVALGRTALVHDDLAAGRLVAPFGPRVPCDYGYTLVCRPAALHHPPVAAFRKWLLAEAAATTRAARREEARMEGRALGPPARP
jgi:LysR family glycine cleavage system transcriptional activator